MIHPFKLSSPFQSSLSEVEKSGLSWICISSKLIADIRWKSTVFSSEKKNLFTVNFIMLESCKAQPSYGSLRAWPSRFGSLFGSLLRAWPSPGLVPWSKPDLAQVWLLGQSLTQLVRQAILKIRQHKAAKTNSKEHSCPSRRRNMKHSHLLLNRKGFQISEFYIRPQKAARHFISILFLQEGFPNHHFYWIVGETLWRGSKSSVDWII